MLLAEISLAIVALTTGAQAVGRAIVTNQCDQTIYLWSVGSSIGPQQVIPKDSSYSEYYHRDPTSNGIALKMTAEEGGIFKPNVSQTIFAYNLDGDQVWYDMSDLFGDGFAGRTMTLRPTDQTCKVISWPAGKPSSGSNIASCQAGTDLELTFCTGKCLPAYAACGKAAPGEKRSCCTACVGDHHCAPPRT